MSILEEIQGAVREMRYYTTGHADAEMGEDDLDAANVLAATLHAEVIEDYPEAYPFPACLVLSWLSPAEPVHVVWAFDASRGYAAMVTTYRPDPARWSADFRKRVKP
jgi:hypothetical protein